MAGAKPMVCEICGKKGAQVRRVARTYGKGKNPLVIEEVSVVSCPHCGESYLEARTLHELECIRIHRRRLAVKQPIPVAKFSGSCAKSLHLSKLA